MRQRDSRVESESRREILEGITRKDKGMLLALPLQTSSLSDLVFMYFPAFLYTYIKEFRLMWRKKTLARNFCAV